MSEDEDAKAQAERQLRQQVAALAIKFLQRTQEQATSLHELIVRLADGDLSVLARIQELSHKIHGSGAMFGFARISQVGGEIEQLCCDRRAVSEPVGPAAERELVQRLNDAVGQLARATADAQRSSPAEIKF